MPRFKFKTLFTLLTFLLFFPLLSVVSDDVFYDIKCLTFSKNRRSEKKDFPLLEFDSTGRPINQCIAISKSGLFAVHYDISGKNKVPPIDFDNNGIPDFVDSALFYLDYTYSVYVDSIGFKPPPPDTAGRTPQWDFYLHDIGNGYYTDVGYGFTMIEQQVVDSIHSPCPRFTSFAIVDNDFSPKDSLFFDNGTKRATFTETGFDGLKITLAHELHHIFQFGYGDCNFPSINELTSTFMEYRIHPHTRDYLQYVRSLFRDFSKYILSNPYYSVGYRYAIFFQYIYKIFGDRPILETWNNIGKGIQPLRAMDLALKQHNSSLSSALKEFMEWVHFSGERAKPNLLPNAEIYPPITYKADYNFVNPGITASGTLLPLEVRPLRCFLPSENPETLDDTLFIYLLNIDTTNAFEGFKDSSSTFDIFLTSNSTPNSRQLLPRNVFYLLHSENQKIADEIFLNLGYEVFAIDFAFPNPFRSSDQALYFPVPKEAPVKEKVELKIFDIGMNELPLGQSQFNVELYNQKKILILESSKVNLPSGTYFFETKYQNSRIFGKFTVVK